MRVNTKISRTPADTVARAILANEPIAGSNFEGKMHSGRIQATRFNCGPAWASLDTAKVSYVIYSYATPIAWLSDGVWYVDRSHMSPPTTGHQTYALEVVRATCLPVEVLS